MQKLKNEESKRSKCSIPITALAITQESCLGVFNSPYIPAIVVYSKL